MVTRQPANLEKHSQIAVHLHCLTEDQDGNLFTVSTNGNISQVKEGQMDVTITTSGQHRSRLRHLGLLIHR